MLSRACHSKQLSQSKAQYCQYCTFHAKPSQMNRSTVPAMHSVHSACCIYEGMYVCVCVCARVSVSACVCVYVCMYVCMYACRFACLRIHPLGPSIHQSIHLHGRTYTHPHTHTHTYIYMHIRMHTDTNSQTGRQTGRRDRDSDVQAARHPDRQTERNYINTSHNVCCFSSASEECPEGLQAVCAAGARLDVRWVPSLHASCLKGLKRKRKTVTI